MKFEENANKSGFAHSGSHECLWVMFFIYFFVSHIPFVYHLSDMFIVVGRATTTITNHYRFTSDLHRIHTFYCTVLDLTMFLVATIILNLSTSRCLPMTSLKYLTGGIQRSIKQSGLKHNLNFENIILSIMGLTF